MRCPVCDKLFDVEVYSVDMENMPTDTNTPIPKIDWHYCPICGAEIR